MDIRIVSFDRKYKNGQPVDWVELTNRGAVTENGALTHSTRHPVKSLVPPEDIDDRDSLRMKHMLSVWSVVGPAYDAWKKGEEIPETGTSLSAWAGVSSEQVKVLKKFELRTVEDVAAMQESVLARIPLPNVRDMRKQAKLYIDGQAASQMATEVTSLREQLDAALSMLEEQQKSEAKRGPGRPKKEEAA